jgi:hypothetical protein
VNWYWVWTGVLAGMIALVAVPEVYAIMTGGKTLSQFTAEVCTAWPPMIWILGVMAGGLAVHFWWRWTPEVVGVTLKALYKGQ